MEVNIGDVAALLDGRLEGASNVPLTGFAGIEEAGTGPIDLPGQSGLRRAPLHHGRLRRPRSRIPSGSRKRCSREPPSSGWRTPMLPWPSSCRPFPHLQRKNGVAPSAVVHADAHIGEGASIGPLCHIDQGASIGDNVVLETGAIMGLKRHHR